MIYREYLTISAGFTITTISFLSLLYSTIAEEIDISIGIFTDYTDNCQDFEHDFEIYTFEESVEFRISPLDPNVILNQNLFCSYVEISEYSEPDETPNFSSTFGSTKIQPEDEGYNTALLRLDGNVIYSWAPDGHFLPNKNIQIHLIFDKDVTKSIRFGPTPSGHEVTNVTNIKTNVGKIDPIYPNALIDTSQTENFEGGDIATISFRSENLFISEYKEILLIFLSTLVGVGVSAIFEGLLALGIRKRIDQLNIPDITPPADKD